jgi:hypothetical protein
LTRDKGSVLAALCLADSPMQLNEDGAFYFDRDWWVPEHSCTRLSAPAPEGRVRDTCEGVAGGSSGISSSSYEMACYQRRSVYWSR